MAKTADDAFDLRQVPRPSLPSRTLQQYGAAPLLQRLVMAGPEEYQAFVEKLMKSERFQKLRTEFEREFFRTKWQSISLRPKLHERKSEAKVPTHVLKRMLIDYRKYDQKRKSEQEKKQVKQRQRWEKIRADFDQLRARNQVAQIVARQSVRWDGNPSQLRQHLTRCASVDYLTKVPGARTKWNDLRAMPKDKLQYSVFPEKDRKAIDAIDSRFIDEYVDALWEIVRRRFIKNQVRAEWESKHPFTPKGKLQSSQSCSSLLQRDPVIPRNHPENAGYDFTDYSGFIFDSSLCPEGKGPIERNPRFDVEKVLEWMQKRIEDEAKLVMKYEKREQRRLSSCASQPNLSTTKEAWRKELEDFERRLPEQKPIRAYDKDKRIA